MKRIALIGLPARTHYRGLLARLGAFGYRVVTVDSGDASVFSGLSEASIRVPDYRTESVLEPVQRYHRDAPLSGIALFHELTVVTSTRVAAALGLPHCPTDQAMAGTDKLAMRHAMRAGGVACPPFAGVENLDEARRASADIGYPVVVKPAVGGASYGVTRVDDEAGLRRFFRRVDIFWRPHRFVIEAYLPGREVSVETVTLDRGRHVHLAVFDKPQSLDGPYFLEEIYVTPGWLNPAEQAAVRASVSSLVEQLGLEHCITHTELRLTDAGPVVVEFGLRPIGWPGPLCVEAASGVDQVAIMAALACGEPLDLPDPRISAAAGWQYLVVRHAGIVRQTPSITPSDGVLDASVWVNPGDRVGVPPVDFNYIKGHFAVTGSTSDEVVARLAAAGWELTLDGPQAGVSAKSAVPP